MAALRHKRPIRNGRLGEIKGQDGFDAMVFGSLQSDVEAGMAGDFFCLRRHRRPGTLRKFGGPDFARGSVSIRR
jgi:hypothetical protein